MACTCYTHGGNCPDCNDRWHARITTLESDLATARAERDAAVKLADDFKRIGQQFQEDARKHFEQGCTNLQRAEAAEKERDAAVAAGRVLAAGVAEREAIFRNLEWTKESSDGEDFYCPHCVVMDGEKHEPGCAYTEAMYRMSLLTERENTNPLALAWVKAAQEAQHGD